MTAGGGRAASRSARRWLPAALLLVLPLVGCSGQGATSPVAGGSPTGAGPVSPPASAPASGAASAPEGGSGSASPQAGASTAPAPPQDGACYRLSLAELTRRTNASTPVDCSADHDTVTIYVGRLDDVVDGHALSVTSDHVQHQLSSTCPRRFAAFVGGSRSTRELSRLQVVWFSPPAAQLDRGASWFRCDLIGFAGQDTLLSLPPTCRLHHALDRHDALARYGLCGTAAPGTAGFHRVICSEPHAWQAISVIRLPGGDAYPGVAKVRSAGDSSCRDQVHARAGTALKFSYGWEWPTAQQWRSGQHYGYCWAPS